jgi:hypothetical protein
MINELTDAIYGADYTPRSRYQFRQSLLGLVRLAKSEQLLEMRRDVQRAAGAVGDADLLIKRP